MSCVTFHILSDLGIVYVKYRGFIDIASTRAAAETCTTDPAFHPGLPHLFDCTDVTGHEQDFATFFALQAQLVDVYLADGNEALVVFVAPDGPPRALAQLAAQSWQSFDRMSFILTETRSQALDILSVTEDAFGKHLTAAS